MKTVHTFGTLNAAFLAQAWLESCGLRTLIPDENTATGALPHVSVYSGIRLQVEEEDFEKALVLLKDFELPKAQQSEAAVPSEPVFISRAAVRGLFILNLLIGLIFHLHGYGTASSYSEEMLEYLGSIYLWYEGAYLCYLLFYPLMGLYVVAGLGLIFFRNWSRYLYLALWVPAFFTMLFSSANLGYGWTSFLSALSCFSGGFLCCLMFFTPVSRYFGKSQAP